MPPTEIYEYSTFIFGNISRNHQRVGAILCPETKHHIIGIRPCRLNGIFVVVAEQVNYFLYGFFAEPSINFVIQLFDLSLI